MRHIAELVEVYEALEALRRALDRAQWSIEEDARVSNTAADEERRAKLLRLNVSVKAFRDRFYEQDLSSTLRLLTRDAADTMREP